MAEAMTAEVLGAQERRNSRTAWTRNDKFEKDGYLIVKNCLESNIEVESLPGPTALIPALIVSGIPCERFTFEGFLPQKKGRQTRLKILAEETKTLIFYESPFRVKKTLAQFVKYMGEDRNVSISREISKKFEETIRGSVSEVLAHFQNKEPKGEFVIVLEGK